ncbi:MAG TPA: TlpA disulfide reductase family protein [Actinomycetota bacterium]|nr:TlpA disulfide reductase family protein [Actinomycetota bacterium]
MESSDPTRRRWLRVAWLLGPSLAFVLLLGAGIALKGSALEPGDDAPPVEAPTLDGDGALALADLRGKPVLVNFWASWCVPCEAEARYLEAAHREYGDEVHFLGVNVKDARSDALAFVERYDVEYAQVRDEELEWYDAFGLTGQPETFLIDADGEVVEHVTGEFTSADDLFRLLDVMVARNA